MQKNNFVHVLTKILIDIMFFSGIAVLIATPFALPTIFEFIGISLQRRLEYTIMLVGSGLCALYILWQLKLMFKTLITGNPFITKNVSCLRKCAVASGIIALIFLVRLFFAFTFAGAIVVIMFTMLSLFCLTLKDLFKQAVAYKEETDWTV